MTKGVEIGDRVTVEHQGKDCEATVTAVGRDGLSISADVDVVAVVKLVGITHQDNAYRGQSCWRGHGEKRVYADEVAEEPAPKKRKAKAK